MEEVLEKPLTRYVGRLAPSPTGALHLGNVRTFMIAWLRARSQGGKVILRMEDLDHPKDKPGAAVQAIEDLRWLGFDWDEEYEQSARKPIYHEALEALRSQVYPCVCSRRDVEAAQSAPHAGEQLYYPGTCRRRFASWAEAQLFLDASAASKTSLTSKASMTSLASMASTASSASTASTTSPTRTPCWRFRVAPGTVVAFDDAFAGRFEQNVSQTLGDFPLARDEFGAGYTLACTVDDLLMGVTEVVRGDDLLAATPAQILLAKALTPFVIQQRDADPHRSSLITHHSSLIHHPLTYCHVPLVVGRDGKRLAKRHGDTRVAAYRAEGKRPEEILGFLAASCGWAKPGERISLADLIPRFDLTTIPHAPFMI